MRQRKITAAEVTPSPIFSGEVMLALSIIRQAQRDYELPKCRAEVTMFFKSDWYKTLLDLVSAHVPGFRVKEDLLPVGVVLTKVDK